MAIQPKVEIFTLSINAINYIVKKYIDNNIEITLKGKTLVDLFSKLPLDYYSYADVFFISESDKLLFYQSYNYTINLESGTKLDYELLYEMSRDGLLILKKYLKNNLCKKFI